MAMTRQDWLAAVAAVVGPALFLIYYWTEAVFGPSQPAGGPLRIAIGITLVIGGLLCSTLAILRLHALGVPGSSRIGRLGARLCSVAMALLTIGLALWWPVLFTRPDRLGPLAGGPVGLGMLLLFGGWLLVGLRLAPAASLPGWVRPLPLAALALLLMLFLVPIMPAAPWPVVAAVIAAFAAALILVACGIWQLAARAARPHGPGVIA